MKKLTKLLLTLLILTMSLSLITLPTFAETSGQCGDNAYWNYDSGTLTITGTGDLYDYEFGYNVPWHSIESEITKVNIGDGITKIGRNNFDYCNNITSISAKNVKYIGQGAFYSCDSLESVSFGDVDVIDIYAFEFCDKLTTIKFGNVGEIRNYAFNGCNLLKNITFGDIDCLGYSSFEDCPSITSVKFNNVNKVDRFAFNRCFGLKKVSFNNVDTICSFAFDDCKNLQSVTLKSVNTIENNIFTSGNEKCKIYIPLTKLLNYRKAFPKYKSNFIGTIITGSVVSDGNLIIVGGIAGLSIVAVTLLIYNKKRKQTN